ncbi:MAG: hypothetical protein LBG96_07140 [Tannerella sp.]|jgi:hypothetical protein|nr:hypothetical protein [Tannerella sp.]
MSSINLDALTPSINKVFEKIRSRISDMERHPEQRERIINAICDYVAQTITAESKSLLSSFYSSMVDETLAREPFLTTRNKNKFYDKDILRNIPHFLCQQERRG